MGLFDSIKDALTTDDGERLEAAQKELDKATADLEKVKAEVGTAADPASRTRLEKAQKAQADAHAKANELAAKVNPQAPAPEPQAPAAPAVDQAQADRDAEAIRNIEAMKAKAEAEKAAEAERVAAEQAAAAPAAPAEPLAAPAEPELRTYTVVKGDNLTKIGRKFGVSWKSIAELNGIKNPDLIHPGDVFKIPNA